MDTDISHVLKRVDKPQSLKGLAYTTIKEAILSLKLAPGHSLSNRELAAQLGISETPIRDALQELERDGFVRRIPQRGTFVTEIDLNEIRETFQIRAVLEQLAVQLAGPQLDWPQLDTLTHLLTQADDALARGEWEACSQLGMQFHQVLIQTAGSQKLLTLLGQLDDHLKRFRRLSALISGRLEKSQQEHHQVLNALRMHSFDEAGQSMRHHLESVLADIDIHQQDEQNKS
ncbi:MAG: GntR family transcriptional regulator [Chloroflexota bacterium]